MSLDDLRRELGEVDRGILELAARRRELARAVERAKAAAGRPIRDFAQEREVLERGARIAAEVGLGGDVAAGLLRALIVDALTVQEQQRLATRRDEGGQALVVGGSGRMGRWLVQFLDSQGFGVEVADPAGPVAGHAHLQDWRDSRLEHDFVVVAADLRTSRSILLELAERRPRGVVFDVGSLKAPLRDGLRRLVESGVRTTSVHPMFGPDTVLLSGRHVIFVDVGMPEATAAARRLFSSTMAELVDMELEDHDRLMAYVLGLSHALNISFTAALARSGEAVPRLRELSSTTFEAQLAVAGGVAGENPGLYYEIQHLNRYGPESLAALGEALDRLRAAVAGGDEEAFVDLMRQGRRVFEARGAPGA